MFFIMINKLKAKINLKEKKNSFLLFINLIPILLILSTSLLSGAEIRTMWMTPFIYS